MDGVRKREGCEEVHYTSTTTTTSSLSGGMGARTGTHRLRAAVSISFWAQESLRYKPVLLSAAPFSACLLSFAVPRCCVVWCLQQRQGTLLCYP